jgi:energy-coupling factor transporter ATP-binding protein EcfA2
MAVPSSPQDNATVPSFPWTLSVEGLGKLRDVELEPRPLMLFVGENNTGKSYLLSLLWGLLTRGDRIFEDTSALPCVAECDAWVRRVAARVSTGVIHRLGPEDFELLTRFLNEALTASRKRLVADVFSSTTISVEALRITLKPFPVALELSRTAVPDPQNEAHAQQQGTEERRIYLHEKGLEKIEARPLAILPALLGVLLFGSRGDIGWPGTIFPEPAVFFPSSRTGFLLTYPALVRQQLSLLAPQAAGEPRVLSFPLPVVDFLQRLAWPTASEHPPFAAEARFLEDAALGGRLEICRRGELAGFLYHPRVEPGRGDLSLPMSLSSSLVTELAPLIFIMGGTVARFLLIEEPEAHLHPHLQRKLAQAVARLVRKGANVWLTTHSENFCQQINNFIKLGTHPSRTAMQRELGYEEADYLLPQEVGAFQFRSVGDRSEVMALETSDLGIPMPSFNEELYRLAMESQRLDETREEL